LSKCVPAECGCCNSAIIYPVFVIASIFFEDNNMMTGTNICLVDVLLLLALGERMFGRFLNDLRRSPSPFFPYRSLKQNMLRLRISNDR